MEYADFKARFGRAVAQNGIVGVTNDQIRQFYEFNSYLLEVNQTTNLTAIRDLGDVIYKHDVDSLLALSYIPERARVLDLGCGPGFPSIPLAIARPDLSIISLDSTAKKIAFVKSAVDRLGLDNLVAVSGRAEDASVIRSLGEFDVVISRAVARMNVLAELCVPYVRIGGFFIALKGAKGDEELAEARGALKRLGCAGVISDAKRLVLADETSESRCIAIAKKERPTPKGFPRSYAAILKKPL